MKTFGLLGRNISYSFSNSYFSKKFTELKLDKHQYVNFDFEDLSEFNRLISDNNNPINGMNVTIPYKQDVMQFLDEIDEVALEIGAVNTVKFLSNGKTKGFNTDVYGFEKSLRSMLGNQPQKALILGTGGASKAVAFVLTKLQISFFFVSRNPKGKKQISYSEIDENLLKEYKLLINCTPLGTFPDVKSFPNIPYQHITSKHVLYDLIYNPSVTTFLEKGKEKGALIKNGLEMLQLQAEKSWQIWNR